MHPHPRFLDLPQSAPERADVLLLPCPYEGTVSYGPGTASAPRAIWEASQHIECWDEELDWDLNSLHYHSADPVVPASSASPEDYQHQLRRAARDLHACGGLVVGVGGEHGVSPALASAACVDPEDLSHLTVVQIDAHADLRDHYHETPYSHACAMRRVLDKQASILAIGIRSADHDEFRHGCDTGRVRTFFAQQLADGGDTERKLIETLGRLHGDCYLTVDMDGLDAALCPGTGTPQPGGLGWWQALRYLRHLLLHNPNVRLVGFDVVECVAQPQSQVNQMAAAKLLAKVLAYHFCGTHSHPADPSVGGRK
jgi:agmatinase